MGMGCCGGGDDEDDGITAQLLPTKEAPDTFFFSSSDDPVVTISPMNSNFSALSSSGIDILRGILSRLSPADLARAACVCRVWREVASEREMLEGAFRSPWKLKRVVGMPSSPAFWRHHPTLSRFAISHCLLRGDTVAGLALKYSVQVMDIKRLNNMMSDHGIYSRERLLIPVSKPDLLFNSTCYIEMDDYAKREVAVLYLEGFPEWQTSHLTNRTITERGKRKILESVKRSMQVNDGTAEYYMSISNGDPRAAISEFTQDLRWEQQRRNP